MITINPCSEWRESKLNYKSLAKRTSCKIRWLEFITD